jgi:cell division GTPase FtsZ
MGIGKSRITPSINVDDMLEKAEINHEIEAEKQDADKRLAEVREAKQALVKIHQDLQDAIKAERDAAMVLQEAISSSDNIINGICNAIVKAKRDTQFKATIRSEHLAQLQELLNQAIKAWKTVLENHHSEQMKMLTEHESNIRKLLRRNEGVWFSDFWMKVLVIFLFVYTVALGLVVYCTR